MQSRTSNPYQGIKRRTLRFAIVLGIGLYLLHTFLLSSRIETKKAELVVEITKTDEKLSNELYRLFHGLENDFLFFEKEISTILKGDGSSFHTQVLLNFLGTHPYYLKIRLINNKGKEVFKILHTSESKGTYYRSENLFDLSDQNFFQELKQATHEKFFFSSMDANIVNGVVVTPLTPTVRVSKRVYTHDSQEALLVINIDGQGVLGLFDGKLADSDPVSEKILVDYTGAYAASSPLLPIESYTTTRKKLDDVILKKLIKHDELHGTLDHEKDVFVYTTISLPRSNEKWALVSRVPEERIFKLVYSEMLTWIFWELLIYVLCITWYWKAEKKKFREQVVQVLLRERSEFIQNVSHQLKTPLAIIFNHLVEGDIQNHTKEIKGEVSYLLRVIDDLLLLSHIETFKQLTLKKENLIEILQDAVTLIAEKSKKKSVRVKMSISDELSEGFSDLERFVLPELMKTAFFNLLDNAVDFSPVDGEINVSVKKNQNRLIISFADQGPGIPESFIPHLFERFSRAPGQSRKGSGLGLAITKKVIDLHGGEISFRVSNGTVFEIAI